MMKKLYHYILHFHISAHTKNVDETTRMSFFIEDDEFLKKEKSHLG